MKRLVTVAVAALAMLTGCAGTRTPKLAKCAGPYRYANTYGTVLPSLPIPAQPSASSATVPTPAQPVPPPAPPAASPPPTVDTSPAAPPPPAPPASDGKMSSDRTSALMPYYSSC